MVDSTPQSGNRSLSADTELSSAYNYLRNGDYKQCKRTIDKKLPKLKSEQDKVNFNIVKLLLLNKTKKLKESKKLIELLRKEFITSQILISNKDLTKYFIGILRELDEEQSANEIYKISIKALNLAKIPRDEQSSILKQLTANFDFGEIYTKINAFLKNENDPDKKFLTLLKYEIIYILAFKQGKISKAIVNITLKEMINNYSTLSKEKGFVDILVKYLTSLNDSNTFLNLFENKQVEFTNAPLKDLFVSIYLEKGDDVKLINYIVKEILNNLNEWNFVWYERLVNLIFYIYKEKYSGNKGVPNQGKFASLVDEMAANFTEENIQNFTIESLEVDVNLILSQAFNFFNCIQFKLADKRTNLNAYKSTILAKLLIYHQIILWTGNYDNASEQIKSLILEMLENSVNKQSILHEVSKFFIYLNDQHRSEILSRFVYDTQTPLTPENTSSMSYKEQIIFFHKLEKMLIGNLFTKELKSLCVKLEQLIKIYFILSSNGLKLEKGERLFGDDLIVLINEYFFEFTNTQKNSTSLKDESFLKLAYSVLSLDSLALERSPHNYDISIFSLKIAGYLNLPAKVLEILKYMNLKGPQFETVSYIAYPFFQSSFYKPGLNYLAESIEKWEKDNKKSVRSTLWKMFTGRNFWSSEELLQFLTQNEDSYYRYLIRFIDLTGNFNENLTTHYEDESLFKETFAEYSEIIYDLSNQFENRLKSANIHKNQDMIISLFKFKEVKFFDGHYDILKLNKNYIQSNFRFKIDSLSKNNLIYELYPSYKNNFLETDDVDAFGIFDEMKFLSGRMWNRLNFSVSTGNVENLTGNLQEIRVKYISSSQDEFSFDQDRSYILQLDSIERNLFRILGESENNFENYLTNEAEVLKSYSELKENILDKITESRQNYNIFDFNSKSIFKNIFNYFKNFNLFNLVLITEKFLDLINDNKKTLKESAGALKVRLNNSFKSHVLNLLTENVVFFESLMNKIHIKEVNVWLHSSFSVLSDETNSLMISEKNFFSDLASKFVEEQKEQLKSLIETSKLFKNYVKEKI